MQFVLKILTTKPNMQVIAGLWVLSVIGSLFSFLTLIYISKFHFQLLLPLFN